MVQNVAVVTVHGINTSSAGYSEPFKLAVSRALPKRVRSCVAFREVVWADILRGRQEDYLTRAEGQGLNRTMLRAFVVRALGDAAAYQKTKWASNSAYYQIQDRLLDKLIDLETDEASARPVILVGHSLGCHIISSFAWDVHRWKQEPQSVIDAEPDADLRQVAAKIRAGGATARLDTFAGFITLGSNMPLFTFTFGPDRVFPITRARQPDWAPAFPGQSLPPQVRDRARWLNVYSPNDPLGYPLKALNPAYEAEDRLTDVPVKVEGMVPNPYSAHVKYWTHPRVVRESAKLILDVIEADSALPTA
ncbi:MAG: hypothetical protein AB7O04_08805 [Hyphomonadaceae bacterium]